MLDVKIGKVPSRTTVSRMAIELNVNSDLKVCIQFSFSFSASFDTHTI